MTDLNALDWTVLGEAEAAHDELTVSAVAHVVDERVEIALLRAQGRLPGGAAGAT